MRSVSFSISHKKSAKGLKEKDKRRGKMHSVLAAVAILIVSCITTSIKGNHHGDDYKLYYPKWKMTLIGKGKPVRYVKLKKSSRQPSFEECAQHCVDFRARMKTEDDKNDWNGVIFSQTDNQCACVKQGEGHKDVNADGTKWIHFRFLLNPVVVDENEKKKAVSRIQRMFYPQWKLSLIGEGRTKQHQKLKSSSIRQTFEECAQHCVDFKSRMRDADNAEDWNGVMFNPGAMKCECAKGDKGHVTNNSGWIHYRFLRKVKPSEKNYDNKNDIKNNIKIGSNFQSGIIHYRFPYMLKK